MTRRLAPMERTRAESAFVWTDENTEIAATSFRAGVSASQIAKDIGASSRNSVIGRMARKGVTGCRQVAAPLAGSEKKTVLHHGTSRSIPPPIKIEPIPLDGVTIFNLLPFHASITSCRRPIGGTGADTKFCGAKTKKAPYCRSCRALCYQTISEARKSASTRGALWAAGK